MPYRLREMNDLQACKLTITNSTGSYSTFCFPSKKSKCQRVSGNNIFLPLRVDRPVYLFGLLGQIEGKLSQLDKETSVILKLSIDNDAIRS